MSTILDRLRAAQAPKVEEVTIGGVSLQVRGMGPLQRSYFLQCTRTAAIEGGNVPDHVVVALGLCTAEGIQDDAEQDAVIAELRKAEGAEVYKAAEVVLRLSGFGKGAVEAAEKNAEPAGAPVPLPAGARAGDDGRAAAARA